MQRVVGFNTYVKNPYTLIEAIHCSNPSDLEFFMHDNWTRRPQGACSEASAGCCRGGYRVGREETGDGREEAGAGEQACVAQARELLQGSTKRHYIHNAFAAHAEAQAAAQAVAQAAAQAAQAAQAAAQAGAGAGSHGNRQRSIDNFTIVRQ
eukprot:824560-Rhodomonas_salina.1